MQQLYFQSFSGFHAIRGLETLSWGKRTDLVLFRDPRGREGHFIFLCPGAQFLIILPCMYLFLWLFLCPTLSTTYQHHIEDGVLCLTRGIKQLLTFSEGALGWGGYTVSTLYLDNISIRSQRHSLAVWEPYCIACNSTCVKVFATLSPSTLTARTNLLVGKFCLNSCQRKPRGMDVEGGWKEVEDGYLLLGEREREKEQWEANANPLIKATTASLETRARY